MGLEKNTLPAVGKQLNSRTVILSKCPTEYPTPTLNGGVRSSQRSRSSQSVEGIPGVPLVCTVSPQ